MIKRTVDASVTVYFCLSIVLVAGLLLTLLEAVRFEGLKTDAEEWTDLAVESLCAGYQSWMFKEYDMFLLDGHFGTDSFSLTDGEEELEALLFENLQWAENKGINFYRMGIRNVTIKEYTLLTDDDGKVFMHHSAETMKKILSKQAAQKILEQITETRSSGDVDVDFEQSMNDAEQKLLELQQAAQADSNSLQEAKGQAKIIYAGDKMAEFKGSNADTSVAEASANIANPLEDIKPLRQQGIWSMAIPGGKTVSNKAIKVENSLLKRQCQKGTDWQKISVGWYERILMQEYFKPLGGNFIAPDTEGALSYGMEYLLWGESSDEENLKKTVDSLLLLREAANYLYLQKDSVKQAEALSVATLLAGASANPAVIEVVKQGLLAAWAYAESILDVKALLSGGKIPLIKTSTNWQTSLSGLAGVGSQDYAGETQGLTYNNYLDAFLYAKTDKTVAYRMMDLMEQKLCLQSEYANSRMDNMITAVKIEAEYSSDTVFAGIFTEDSIGGYTFLNSAEYVYQ